MRMTQPGPILHVEEGSEAWYAIIRAADEARTKRQGIGLDILVRDDGRRLVMVKVGSGVWSPPYRIVRDDPYYPMHEG